MLQYGYAQRLDVAMEEVRVGMYDFETGVYSSRAYSSVEVKAARNSLNKLLEALDTRFSKKP